jgi:hypothetical protein
LASAACCGALSTTFTSTTTAGGLTREDGGYMPTRNNIGYLYINYIHYLSIIIYLLLSMHYLSFYIDD